jgi:predicted transcriptional regulator
MRLIPGDTALMVFSHLALHESEQRTLFELASAIGRAPQVVQRAVRSLVADDLVTATPKAPGTGRGAVYSVNMASPIFPELRQVALKLLGGMELAKEMRAELGDAPVRTNREVMARLAEAARAAETRRGQAR